ncbi:MAG: hypothetical protein ACE5FP_04265 [Gemmatimonadota bacterium]
MSAKSSRRTLLMLFLVGPFLLTSPLFGQSADDGITVEYDRMWADYDVTQGNETGILFHVTFSVQHMKGVSGHVAYGFEKENGDRLYTSNSSYVSTNGQLTVYREIQPSYENTTYEDLQVFIPYREITVGEGSHDLRVHVDVIYGDGGNVHLTYYSFPFTRTF